MSVANGLELVGNNKCSLTVINGLDLVGNRKYSLSVINGLEMVGNRKYLRFRATKVIGGDTLTQEMCHRYLVGIQDEEYLNEVGQ